MFVFVIVVVTEILGTGNQGITMGFMIQKVEMGHTIITADCASVINAS